MVYSVHVKALNPSLGLRVFDFIFVLSVNSLDPNDQKSLEGMQKMEKEESPTDATVELDGDDIAVTYIKDVSFNTNRPDVDVLKMTKVA